jgi:hypothetical protein
MLRSDVDIRGHEIELVQYQINHSIEMKCKYNFIVSMSQN